MEEQDTPDAFIRSTHPDVYRSGQWARIVGIEILNDDPDYQNRACIKVLFIDGVTDWWPLNDPDDKYEFASTLP